MSSPLSGPLDRGTFGAGSASLRPPASSLFRGLLHDDTRVEALARYATLAARVLLSQIFLVSGFMKILDWSGTEAKMAEQHMFWIPFFHVAALLVELAAGLSLLLGFKARLGALLLFLYLIPVTLTFHHFWSYPPDKQQIQVLFFQHNLALMGGLLFVMACGAGALSLDRWLRRT